eukprot:scaffold81827_cov57-Phaeocystis_antarctica.AAC.3
MTDNAKRGDRLVKLAARCRALAADEAAALPTHGRMLRHTALACLAAMASALTPASVLRPSPASALRAPTASRAPKAPLRAPLSSRVQRSRTPVAQYGQQENLPAGWTSGFDQASQATYYVDEVTGVSQWEPVLTRTSRGLSTRHRAACPEAPRTVRTPYAYQPRACRTYRVSLHHRWEPPHAAAYWDSSRDIEPDAAAAAAAPQAAQVVWRIVPTCGVCNVVFNVGNGQQQVLGRSQLVLGYPNPNLTPA